MRWRARMPLWLSGLAASACLGCFPSPLPPYLGIHKPYAPPQLPPPAPAPERLPQQPAAQTTAAKVEAPAVGEESIEEAPNPRALPQDRPLSLEDVLISVDRHFPLLLAVQQERGIATGQRVSAEGGFDPNLRGRTSAQGGTFPNERLDVMIEQATPWSGLTAFGGYRFGFGDFPVYYGDRKTADGGEFRGGLQLPLLRDSAIDRRRAALRQAQIQEHLAEPVIQRARIDYLRNAARSYWAWVAAGLNYRVADSLLQLARDRQAGLQEQFRRGAITEFVVIDNSRLIAEREGALFAADRRWQQASFELSLFLRDERCNPLVPPPTLLPTNFVETQPPPPLTQKLPQDIQTAYELRPELARFELLKEQVSVDLKLAENQTLPALNAGVFGAQDVGKGKKGEGQFALERSVIEGAVTFEMPLHRRDARGKVLSARSKLAQLLAQERFVRDQIGAEVQDAVSAIDRTYQRLERAREEQKVAVRVAELERDRFSRGQSNLLEVNLRELAAAGAQAKVIDTLAEYHRALAEHRAALGLDAAAPPPH